MYFDDDDDESVSLLDLLERQSNLGREEQGGPLSDILDSRHPYNPWQFCGEKSAKASQRERAEKAKFDATREKLEKALVTNKIRVVELGCDPESESCFRFLPAVAVGHIFQFLHSAATPAGGGGSTSGVASVSNTTNATTARAGAKASSPKGKPKKDQDDAKEEEPFDMNALYVPGKKHVIPLSTPDLHLTAPCWRDFSRYVRNSHGENWNVKRVAATPEEKAKFREHRKGTVYFIQAIYTVPGGAAAAAKASKKKTTTSTKKRKISGSNAAVKQQKVTAKPSVGEETWV